MIGLRHVWVARACLGVFVAGAVGVVVVGLLGGETSSQQLLLVALGAYGGVGYVVAVRRPANPLGWLMLASAALGGVFGLCQAVASWAGLRDEVHTWWDFLASWPQNMLWLPLVTVSTTLPVLLFPDGTLLSRRWRPVAVVAIANTVFFVVLNAMAPVVGTAVSDVNLDNPLSPPFMRGAGNLENWPPESLMLLLAVVTLVLAGVSVAVRWHRARDTERLQLRWFLFGATGLAAGTVLNLFVPPPWGNTLLMLGFVVLPVCMGVSILRYRLYDIDRVISRTVSYAIVTGAALATYLVIVTSAARLVPNGSPPVVVAGATLAAAAIVRPLLRRVRVVVDHRFDRAHYDAQLIVDTFGARLRDRVDSDATAQELVGVVRATVAPERVQLWLTVADRPVVSLGLPDLRRRVAPTPEGLARPGGTVRG
jgi:hypothetical protein